MPPCPQAPAHEPRMRIARHGIGIDDIGSADPADGDRQRIAVAVARELRRPRFARDAPATQTERLPQEDAAEKDCRIRIAHAIDLAAGKRGHSEGAAQAAPSAHSRVEVQLGAAP